MQRAKDRMALRAKEVGAQRQLKPQSATAL